MRVQVFGERTDYIRKVKEFTFHYYNNRLLQTQVKFLSILNRACDGCVIRGKVILDVVELMTLPYERQTTGFWIDVNQHILKKLEANEIDGAAAIHAAEHAILNQFALSQDMKADCRVVKEGYHEGVKAKRPPR